MASVNTEVAVLLREYAELLVLTGGDQFRVRSYEKAAKAVAGYRTTSARCRNPR
jgi:DNA polymerase (family X)